MIVVGFDLGKKGAWVAIGKFTDELHAVDHGTWDFTKEKMSRGRMWDRFKTELYKVSLLYPRVSVCEETPFHRGRSYVQGFLTLVEAWAWFHGTECVAVHLSKVKAHAFKGGATKEEMSKALRERHPSIANEIDMDNDDVVDAAWVALWFLERDK